MNTENHYQETDLGNIAPNPRGEYSPEESYEYLDLVVFEGGSYVCLAENGTTITGISPESGKTTQYWQVITIPGDLTPEYIAMHDRVKNLSEQVEADAEEVRAAEQNVSVMELNVTQMQEQTRQSAEASEQSKDSAAGYAASADASRRAAEESEQNINAQVTGFDAHVAEKTSEAVSDIEAARIAANKAILAQQEQSVNEVVRVGNEAISTAQEQARVATEKASEAAKSEKNAASSEAAAKLSEKNATKMAEQVAADKEQVANDRTAVEKAKQEMTESVAQIDQNTQGISELNGDLENSKKAIAELNDKKITKFYADNLGNTTLNDSDNGKITDMMVFGKGFQQTYTGKNLFKPTKFKHDYYIINSSGEMNGGSNLYKCTEEYLECDFVGKTITISPQVGGERPGISFYDSDKNYISGSHNYTGISVPENAQYYRITFGVNDTEIQIEIGSEATTYEPYVGGIPSPNPDYPQEIKSVVNPVVKVTGKNLYQGTKASPKPSDGWYCIYGGVDSTTMAIEDYKIPYGVNLTLSLVYSGALYVSIRYKKNGKFITLVNERSSKTITFNIPVDYDELFIFARDGTRNDLIINNIQLELGSTATDYEPYKEQIATLPYTLNAIPVTEGGNVTIDGQQYIADYVDVENKQLVRNVGIVDLGTLTPEFIQAWGSGKEAFRYTSIKKNLPTNYFSKSIVISESYKSVGKFLSWQTITEKGDDVIGAVTSGNEYGFIIRDSSFTDVNSFKQAMTGSMICYELATPTITDLTDEEVQAFKDLMTYYSTTNVIVTSDQLDGFTTFNYPLSMANGWNLIKEQLGDTREYIYDMELQSAEAYVNSEYAVTLTELGV